MDELQSIASKSGSQPLVSVIIPVFNAENYIAETIQSVLDQNYENIEVICVDDSSSDNSVDVIKRFSDNPQIKLLKSPSKGGNAARNFGFEKSNGDFIQFLDSDDVLEKSKIEKQLNAFDDETDIVVSDYRTFDASLTELISTSTFKNIENHSLSCAITKVISTNSPLYRREIVEKVGGYDPDLKKAQDWDFHIRLVLANAIFSYCEGALTRVRQLKQSVSSDWVDVTRVQCTCLLNYGKLISEHPDFNSEIADFITSLHYNFMVHGFKRNTEIPASFISEYKYWKSLSSKSLKFPKNLIYSLLGLNVLLKLDRLKH